MDPQKTPELSEIGYLAEPLRTSGAFPENVPLAIGVIATHHPKVVQFAAHDTLYTFSVAKDKAHTYSAQAKIHEADAAHEEAAIRKSLEENMVFYEQQASQTTDVDALLKIDKMYRKNLTRINNVHSYPSVARARGKLADTLIAQFNAQQRVAELQEDANIAEEIPKAYHDLGRRARLASYAAGALVALGSVIGMNHLEQQAASYTQTTGVTYEYDTSDKAAGYFVLPTISLTSGYLLGSMGNDHFARRRAKRMVKKARKNAARIAKP